METKQNDSFCFQIWKETPTKDTRIEHTCSIAPDENHKNDFTIASGNLLKMMNL